MANYSNKDILKAFKEINRRIDDLWCYIKECCAKVPRNIGNGEGIYKMFYNDKWQFKSLLAGDNISITSQDDTITITSTVEPIDCEDINDCLGISEEGQPNKFLNEQGDFVTVSGSGFTCSDLSTCSTTNLPEGSNLYFTNPRAVSALTGQNISIFNNNAGYITGVTESPNRVAYFDNNGDLKTNSNFVYNETSNLFTAALPIPGGFYQLSSGGSKIGAGDVSSPDSYIQITPSSISWSFPLLSSDVFFFPYNDGNSGDVMTTDGNGSLTLQPIPAGFTCSDLIGCNISNLTNDSGYITSSALSPYLTSTTAALTYEPLLGFTPENVANKSDSYTTSSSTTYATTKAVVDGLATKLFSVPFLANQFDPLDATNYFFGGITNLLPPSTTNTNQDFVIGYACSIVGCIIQAHGNTVQGTSEDVALSLRNNTANTTTSIGNFKTNATSTTTVVTAITGLNISVSASDLICLQMNGTWATNPTQVRLTGYLIIRL